MRRRVAVTGLGVVTPLGNSVGAFGEGLFAGRSGVGPITHFPPATLGTRIAAEVREFDPEGYRDRKIPYALQAAREAMADADGVTGDLHDRGLSIALGLELFSMDDLVAHVVQGAGPPASPRARLSFLQTPSDLVVPLLCREHGLFAPPLTHVSACAAGTDAVGTAFRLVASGRRRMVLAGGTDSMVNPLGVGGFVKIRALSRRNDDPERASRPFDQGRDGFVLGEGAAFLVLEDFEDVRNRGARVRAEVLGYGTSFDAGDISRPHPEGRGAIAAMERALADARLSADRVEAVNAHGTGTPLNDPVEALALRAVLGPNSDRVPVYAPKSMFGHLVGAAGAVEAAAAVLALERQVLPPTINLENPDPACDLNHVVGAAQPHPHSVVLSNSFGFGGQNSCILLGRPDEAR